MATLLSVCGLTASAQQILPHPNVASCGTNRSILATKPGGTFPLANNAGTFYFDAGSSGVSSVTWGVKGDLALDGAPFTYFTGGVNRPAINIKAITQGTTTQPGYGKGQVTVSYIIGGALTRRR